ncbi:uncharacterized protein [Lepeophtheirus salmonis]|uniref:uncharacterized protein n=1 Tax=Lepeophtheirus salmonis TaxID=72036 RepID=UPI001AE0EF65|nr:uncharacterized protein LOC121123132 [Lepeophtheirus salmonis]
MCDANELLEIQNLKEKLSSLKSSLASEEFTESSYDSDIISITDTGDLCAEVKGLMEDLKSFRVEFSAMKKERSLYKVILGVQEENLALNSELKLLQTKKSNPTITSSEYLDTVDRLENEKSSLNNQLDFYKEKEVNRDKIFIEVENKIFDLENTLKSSKLENQTLKEKLTSFTMNKSTRSDITNGDAEKQKAKLIHNRRFTITEYEQRKVIRIAHLNLRYQCDVIFDCQASISISGPFILDILKNFKATPAPYNYYKFANGTQCKCLGYINVDLYDSSLDIKYCEAQIYIFKEANVTILNRLHWKACKCPNSLNPNQL